MQTDSPWSVAVRKRKGLRPGSEIVFADVTLRNTEAAARWFVLPAQLHEPLRAAFRAELLQVCGFDSTACVRYLQALGADAGLLAFHLASGAALELEGLGTRLDRGVGAFELFAVEALTDAGGRDLEALIGGASEEALDQRLLLEGRQRVSAAYRRRTLRTSGLRGVEVAFEVVARWEGPRLELA